MKKKLLIIMFIPILLLFNACNTAFPVTATYGTNNSHDRIKQDSHNKIINNLIDKQCRADIKKKELQIASLKHSLDIAIANNETTRYNAEQQAKTLIKLQKAIILLVK